MSTSFSDGSRLGAVWIRKVSWFWEGGFLFEKDAESWKGCCPAL